MMKRCVWLVIILLCITIVGCNIIQNKAESMSSPQPDSQLNVNETTSELEEPKKISMIKEDPKTDSQERADTEVTTESPSTEKISDSVETSEVTQEIIEWSNTWDYASESKIHEDPVTLYKTGSIDNKGITIAVNAGHGTKGGQAVYTHCHPDGSPKTTGGSTGAGKTTAAAVSVGTTMLDGTSEADVTLKLAIILKNVLLDQGYNVLMIREDDDVQIDNVARTVYANNNADCHISLHYDSTDSDKGFFCIGVPDIASYKAMEPVASHWHQHNNLGAAIVQGAKEQNIRIYGNGFMGIDLTQTSYSTIPSVDVEVGDCKSDYSEDTMKIIANGITSGIESYFKK